jgi:hypothetical protein
MMYVAIGGAVLAIVMVVITGHAVKNFVVLGMAIIAALAALVSYLLGDAVYAVILTVSGAVHFWTLEAGHAGFGRPVHRPWQRLPDWAAIRTDKREAAMIAAGSVAFVALVLLVVFVQ